MNTFLNYLIKLLLPKKKIEMSDSSNKNLPIECKRTFSSHQGPVHIARFNTTGEYVLSGGQDRTIRLWKPETGLSIKTYSGHGKEVLDISV